ncbi:GIY-YIG nuclease family protein [Fodinicurvata sp. EGI_FJ10296]|uniref:GIY-YIG nuclease family protein n=1 Tax=Fodinicurvata sp. EGI_FJ10296 TaxID=3231908 RepID=UPI0034561AEB
MSKNIDEFCRDHNMSKQRYGYCVYSIHSDDGKNYVGSTTNLYDRIRKHYYELINNKHHSVKLQSEFNKNSSGLSVSILEELTNDSDIKTLRNKEQFWIDKLNSFLEGYNSKSRAEGPEVGLLTYALNLKRSRQEEFIDVYMTKVNYELSATKEDIENHNTEFQETIHNRGKYGLFLFLMFGVGFHFEIYIIMVIAFIGSIFIIFPLPKSLNSVSRERVKREENRELENAKLFALDSLAKIMSYEKMIDFNRAKDLIEDCEQMYMEREQKAEFYRMKSNSRRRLKKYF